MSQTLALTANSRVGHVPSRVTIINDNDSAAVTNIVTTHALSSWSAIQLSIEQTTLLSSLGSKAKPRRKRSDDHIERPIPASTHISCHNKICLCRLCSIRDVSKHALAIPVERGVEYKPYSGPSLSRVNTGSGSRIIVPAGYAYMRRRPLSCDGPHS